jgi:hypothetical protein
MTCHSEYMKWFEVHITFDQSDHSDFIAKLGQDPLIVNPIVKDVRLNRVIVYGGNYLNILFLKTFDQLRLSRLALRLSRDPFHERVPGAATIPIFQITLFVTFETRENF